MSHEAAESSGARTISIHASASGTGARFVGDVTVTRDGDEIAITGARASSLAYLSWYWACLLLLVTLLAWGFWGMGGSSELGAALAVALVAAWAGGLLLMGYRSQTNTVRMKASAVRELAVGFRPRAWHVVALLLTSGLAALAFIPLYRGRYKTVSFLGDDGEGDPVRYRLEARDEREAIQLAVLLAD